MPVHAEDVVTRQYTLRDGLPHSNVFRLLQDKDGFIWAGTENGLCRFDGKRFIKFDDYAPVKGKAILGLIQSSDDAIWVNTYDGRMHRFMNGLLSEIIPEQGQFSAVSIDTKQDLRGRIWSIHHPYVTVYDKGRVDNISLNDYLKHLPRGKPVIKTVFPLHADTVLIGTVEGLFSFTDDGLTLVKGSEGHAVWSLRPGNDNNLLLACTGAILEYVNGEVVPYFAHEELEGKKLQQLEQKDSKSFWIAGEGFGPYTLWTSPELTLDTSTKFVDNQINDIMVDTRSGVWFATYGNGIFYQTSSPIVNFSGKNGLKAGYTTGLTEDADNNMLAATIHGLSRLDVDAHAATSIPLTTGVNNNSTVTWVDALCKDSNATVWVSVQPGSVLHYMDSIELHNNYGGSYPSRDKDKFTIEVMDKTSDQQDGDYIATLPLELFTTSKGDILASFWKGVVSLSNNTVTPMFNDARLDDAIVQCFAEDSTGGIWVGTKNGLFGFNNGAAKFYDRSNGLPDDRVRAVAFDKQGNTWVATDAGIAVKTAEGWKYFDESSGITHNLCTSLAIDNDGTIWVGTQYGLNYIIGDNVFSLDQNRGLVSNEISKLLIDSRGHVWAGTSAGVSSFDPRTFSFATILPPLTFITSIETVRGVDFAPGHIVLPHDSSQIRIQYASLEYEFPEGVEFQYKLENGGEARWSTTDAWEREYPNLAPGEYRFHVRSRVGSGPWSPEATPVRISVQPAYWQTLTFQLAMLSLGMLITGLVFMRVTRRRQKARDEKSALHVSIASLQQQALNLTVNPHFLFNALTSIQNFFNTDNNTYRANLYLSKFSKLVRQVLDDSHREQISLEDEVERLSLYLELEKMRLGNNFEWYIDFKSELDPGEIKIPVMIIQPYVENAIWHGIYPLNGEGEIRIRIEDDGEDRIRIQIIDNGIGMHRSRKDQDPQHVNRSSYGLSVTKKRIELHSKTGKGKIAVNLSEAYPDNAERPGTVVDISLVI